MTKISPHHPRAQACRRAMRVADRLIDIGVVVHAIDARGHHPIIACEARSADRRLHGALYRYGIDNGGRYECYSAPLDGCEARWTQRQRTAR